MQVRTIDSKRLIEVAVVAVVSLTMSTCVEPIDFETDPVGGQLIVDGKITNSTEPYTVTLKQTDASENFPVLVSGATVTLFDDQGQSELLVEVGDGVYQTEGQIQGQAGNTYQIEITVGEGRVYRSQPETMPESIGKDTAYFEVVREETLSESGVLFLDRVVKVYADTELPSNASSLYLKWDVESVYTNTTVIESPLGGRIIVCYFYEHPNAQQVLLFNRQEFPEGDRLEGQLVATREVDYSFLERHYFNVIQSSITQQAYNYWDQVGQLSNRTGSIFDTPPGLVRGNIYNVADENEQVLGYFGASLVDTTRFFMSQGSFRFRIGSTCQCDTCLNLPGARLDGPDYFF